MRLRSLIVLSLVGATTLGASFAAQNKGDTPAKGTPPAAGKPDAPGKSATAPGQEKKAGGADEAAMMEKWAAYAAVGNEHKLLAQKVGKWTFTNKMWMAPGAPPMESTGTNEVKSVMDGRYIMDETRGDMGGQPFHGMGTAGYDNLKKKYVSTWIDNMGTGIMMMEGTYDAATKTLTYKGEMPDPMTGKFTPTKIVEKMDSADQMTMQMYGQGPDGKEFLTMEIVYKRAK